MSQQAARLQDGAGRIPKIVAVRPHQDMHQIACPTNTPGSSYCLGPMDYRGGRSDRKTLPLHQLVVSRTCSSGTRSIRSLGIVTISLTHSFNPYPVERMMRIPLSPASIMVNNKTYSRPATAPYEHHQLIRCTGMMQFVGNAPLLVQHRHRIPLSQRNIPYSR